ncbi:MAG: hypothetical protein J6R83_03760 [Clostridia bacterium]|nr:hypothetical protein [Clostridia bacterium]
MAKKKKQKTSYLPLLSAVLGVVSVIMIFLGAVNYSAVKGVTDLENVTSFTGLQVSLGYSEGELVSLKVLEFSIMNLLAYALALGGVILSVFSYLGKGNKFFAFISAGAFIVSAVFFFLAPTFVVLPKITLLVKENFSLALGSIIGLITSALAGLVSLAQVVKK